MLSDYETALKDLLAFKRKHAEVIQDAAVNDELSDLEDELRFSRDQLIDNLIEDGTIPQSPPEYLSVWNKREAGIQ